MQYWLRRNNIEKGPFTKEALLSQGLNSSDLIKIDGGSEWKSPNSFAELQQGVQSTPKPKYKFTADKKLIEIKDEDQVKPEATAPKPEPSAGTSPFKRMPSALPKKKTTVPPPVDKTGVNINEKVKERAKNSKIEKPLESAQMHTSASAAAHAAANAHQKIHPQIQNLDEAPLREVRHHPSPKPVRTTARPQNSHFFKEFFLPIIIIGGIGFLAWWGYKQFTTPSTDSGIAATSLTVSDSSTAGSEQQDSQKNNTVKTGGPAAIPMHKPNGNAVKTTSQPKSVKDSSRLAKISDKATQTSSRTAASTPSVTAQKTTVPKDSSSDKNTVKPPPAKATAPVEKKADTPATTTAKEAPEKKTPEKKAQKAASIADYVSLSLNKAPEPGIKNVKIRVHNTSKDDLNIAVVEIKYYDKEGKFIQGETLQTGKINAGKTTTLKVPSSRNAERISYKVSLISGDNVYLMGR